MEDSHRIAHGEVQGLQQRKNEQASRKNRSSPPRAILPSTVRNPCCLLGRVVGSCALLPDSLISYGCTLDPEIPEQFSEEPRVRTAYRRGGGLDQRESGSGYGMNIEYSGEV